MKPSRRPAEMSEDHPLYYSHGKEREVGAKWRGRRFGMLFFTLVLISSVTYLSLWFIENPSFRVSDRLPLSLIYAFFALSFSFAGGIAYQVISFRCPRCQYFTGFDFGPHALFGDMFKREAFYCYNCRAQLR